MVFDIFLEFKFLPQCEGFAKTKAFLWWPIFQKLSFLEYLVFFERFFFAQNYCKWFVEWILTCFLEFEFLTQAEDFASAMAFSWWPIFKMVSFLEYLVFFAAVFLHRTTVSDLWNGFWHVFRNFNFWPNFWIFHGLYI